MKSMIIGGAGFVGPYLVRHLHDDLGQDVVVTKMANESLPKEVQHRATVYDLNILDPEQIRTLLDEVRPDQIFHLAAQSSVALSWKNPALTIDVNIKGAANLLDGIREVCPKAKVLLVGSSEEYGQVKQGEEYVTEENPLRPGNIYAATKACQNMIGSIYAEGYGLHIVMVRSFNHIGPNQLPRFVVADFCKQVAEIEAGAEPSIKVGNLIAKRDFTDVRDVVRAYAKVIEKGESGETYNVGSGHAVAIQEILKLILAQSKVTISVEKDPEKFRPVDTPLIEANTAKLKKATGWEPQIPLEQTIRETVEYWREHIAAQ